MKIVIHKSGGAIGRVFLERKKNDCGIYIEYLSADN